MRRKVEDLEQDRDTLKKQVKELTDKISNISSKQNTVTTTGFRRTAGKTNNLAEEKVKVGLILAYLKRFPERKKDK